MGFKEGFLNFVDKVWCVVRIGLYCLAIALLVYAAQERNVLLVKIILFAIVAFVLIIAVGGEVLRYGIKTKCPDCKKWFAHKIQRKEYNDDGVVIIHEKCKKCGVAYMTESSDEQGIWVEVTDILNWTLPILIYFSSTFFNEMMWMLVVYLVYWFVRRNCIYKGMSRWFYEPLIFIGYGIIGYLLYTRYDWAEYNKVLWLVLVYIGMSINLISRIVRFILMTPLYNAKKGIRNEQMVYAHENDLDNDVEFYASKVENAQTVSARREAEMELEKAKTRRDRYYRNK